MDIQAEQNNMIKQQLRAGNVLNEQILSLYQEIQRHEFVPIRYKSFAYSDLQLELSHQQRMMTPLEEALLLQALNLSGTETVLEIGTGSGFLTALLSKLCKQVISIDWYADLTTNAKLQLDKHHCHNVECYTENAYNGRFEQAPFDAIIFTGAIDALTDNHRRQVIPGGKLFAVIGQGPVMQGQLHRLDHHNHWSVEVIFETNLPPLINDSIPNAFIF